MIIDFETYRRAHPRQLDLPFYDQPISNLTPEWFRIMMLHPESRRLVCPTCPRYWYLEDEEIEETKRPGYFLGCRQCLGPLWRIYEEQPNISGMTMIIPRPSIASESNEDMRTATYLNSWEEGIGRTLWAWAKGDFASQVFETEEAALEAWRSGKLVFSSLDEEDMLGALHATAQECEGLLPPFDYWLIDGISVREPSAGGQHLGELPNFEVDAGANLLKMSQCQFDVMQSDFLDESE